MTVYEFVSQPNTKLDLGFHFAKGDLPVLSPLPAKLVMDFHEGRLAEDTLNVYHLPLVFLDITRI